MSKARRVELTPIPGFVIKTVNEASRTYTPASTPTAAHTLESPSTPIVVPKGHKIFINICYDPNVPAPPPDTTESEIRKAMVGEETKYYVPVVASDGRESKDRAGKPSLVFDTVFHPSVKERASKDNSFDAFIIELALERVEEKSGFTLSRELSKPNIASKGPLLPRTVLVPARQALQSKPLVEEVVAEEKPTCIQSHPGNREFQFTLAVPKLTKSNYPTTVLDVEPHRLIFRAPGLYSLDLPVFTNPAGLQFGRLGINVDSVTSEWHVQKGEILVTGKLIPVSAASVPQ